MAAPPSPRETLRLLVAATRSDDVGFLAAAIAYYAFVSMIPLTILALAGASLVGGEAFARAVAGALEGVLTPETLVLLESALESGAGRSGATVAGLLVLAWSGLRLFRGLQTAVARIYGTAGTTSFVAELRLAVVTLGGIAVAVSLLAAVLGVLGASSFPGSDLLAPLATAVLLPVAFYPIYYVLPAVSMTPRETLPGAVLAGLGWTLLGWLFAIYTTYAATASIYGAVGVVLLALAWCYAGSLLVLLGAVLNAVRAGRLTDRQLQQVAGRDPA